MKQLRSVADILSHYSKGEKEMNEAKIEELRKIVEEMDKQLIECAKDYGMTRDRWAMGGMHQLSVFVPRLRELL